MNLSCFEVFLFCINIRYSESIPRPKLSIPSLLLKSRGIGRVPHGAAVFLELPERLLIALQLKGFMPFVFAGTVE